MSPYGYLWVLKCPHRSLSIINKSSENLQLNELNKNGEMSVTGK